MSYRRSDALTIAGIDPGVSGAVALIADGRFVVEYYVTGVTHNRTVFGGFTTTVQLIRGTGFVERIKLSESPY